MKNNTVKQTRICLEEVASSINGFIDEIIKDLEMRINKFEWLYKKTIGDHDSVEDLIESNRLI